MFPLASLLAELAMLPWESHLTSLATVLEKWLDQYLVPATLLIDLTFVLMMGVHCVSALQIKVV